MGRNWEAEYKILEQQFHEANETTKYYQAQLQKTENEKDALLKEKNDGQWDFLKQHKPFLEAETIKNLISLVKEQYNLVAVLPSTNIRNETLEGLDKTIQLMNTIMQMQLNEIIKGGDAHD